ncbi:putative cleavage induced protein [Phytophthora megakarya]|uniref:Putative cleavage induced protein n=1 Tax=Phytophthora megakarya TaxID=4795 RepID=A0A225ULZ5_9STRA|nr:putative cleavage induced protein [Phytophthora megakarya]
MKIVMEPGVLDILIVIDQDLIDPKGIAWVKLEIKKRCAAKSWLERYFVTEWNVFGIANSVVARTNNPLERFNREMNAVFNPYPNLRHFVATIAKIKKTRAHRIDLPPAPDLTVFVVPPASDDEDVRDNSHSSSESLCSEVQDGLNGDLSPNDEIPNIGESAESLEQGITENADMHDFSLDWDGDSESDGHRQTDS